MHVMYMICYIPYVCDIPNVCDVCGDVCDILLLSYHVSYNPVPSINKKF